VTKAKRLELKDSEEWLKAEREISIKRSKRLLRAALLRFAETPAARRARNA
jgi:hypothetical protein